MWVSSRARSSRSRRLLGSLLIAVPCRGSGVAPSPWLPQQHGAARICHTLLAGKHVRHQVLGIVVGDKDYASDPLDDESSARSVEVVAPRPKGWKKLVTQDDERMESYKVRWKMERFFAWLHGSAAPSLAKSARLPSYLSSYI